MDKNGIRIVATGRALPKNFISNDDLSKIVETNDEWITTRTGIKTRYKCEEGESCVTLATEAAKKAIEKADISKDEIGGVIVATSTPDDALPSVACMVQRALGLRENILAFDISAACTGFLYELGIAKGLLYSTAAKYLLVIGSEQLSRIVDYTDRGTCILFGDGAGAAILCADEKEYDQLFWARGQRELLYCSGVGAKEQKISMKGTDVFKFAVVVLKQGIDEILAKNNMTMDDVDCVLCHQANERIIRHVQKKYPGHEDKFYMNLARYGNTSAASIPIALDEVFEAGILKEKMRLLCVGFGAGMTWSSALLEI